ncbi:hypothetical protein [Arthrobacter sp. fls2-241-R2A-200]|nr:hypothetical protein [Arthrobacter sp. fls2-241-R2A-200]
MVPLPNLRLLLWPELRFDAGWPVSCPERFLTILTYEQKPVAAKKIYGLDLPPQDVGAVFDAVNTQTLEA